MERGVRERFELNVAGMVALKPFARGGCRHKRSAFHGESTVLRPLQGMTRRLRHGPHPGLDAHASEFRGVAATSLSVAPGLDKPGQRDGDTKGRSGGRAWLIPISLPVEPRSPAPVPPCRRTGKMKSSSSMTALLLRKMCVHSIESAVGASWRQARRAAGPCAGGRGRHSDGRFGTGGRRP